LPSPNEQPRIAATPVIQANLPPPKPVLYLIRTEPYTARRLCLPAALTPTPPAPGWTFLIRLGRGSTGFAR
jgi:hypothetical protein